MGRQHPHRIATILLGIIFVASMLISTALLFAASCIPGIQARNDTIIEGWVPEPSGRGSWTILWSCLATIFICTWSALYLDVREHGSSVIDGKIFNAIASAVAPEYRVGKAINNYLMARALLKALSKYEDCEWTMTHAQFACGNGFRTNAPSNRKEICSPTGILQSIRAGRNRKPPISSDELKSRSTSDWAIKLFAVVQIVWFMMQVLARAILGNQTIALELLTAGLILCSLVTYGFYWRRPQNVEYPVTIKLSRDVSNDSGLNERGHSGNQVSQSAELDSISNFENERDTTTFAVGSVFGAIHCLAWNSPFPTPTEQFLWRLCSVIVTSLPAINLTVFIYCYYEERPGAKLNYFMDTWPGVWILFGGWGLYTIARIIHIVLAFTSLRALPADAYQTMDWNQYFPHFGT